MTATKTAATVRDRVVYVLMWPIGALFLVTLSTIVLISDLWRARR